MNTQRFTPAHQAGISMVEMMVAVTLGLFILAGIGLTLTSTSHSRTELDRALQQIENGRYAMQMLAHDLRRLANPARLEHDVREERFVEHTLQIAIQAAIDIASHIVSDLRLGEPRTNRALFDLLERGGLLEAPLASTLRNMVGFRNVIVRGYDAVDLGVVRDVLEHRLDDLLTFVAAVRAQL